MIWTATPTAESDDRFALSGYPQFNTLSGFPEIQYAFPLRMSVAHYALGLHSIWKGGLEGRSAEDLRNDITDCTYTAHATFFDGLITRDGRLADVYNLTLIPAVFALRGLTA